jgi:hypothetical protein
MDECLKIKMPDRLWPTWNVIVKMHTDGAVTFTSDGGCPDMGVDARQLRDWLNENVKD